MNCCPKCFLDFEVQATIQNNSTEEGNCFLCGSNQVRLVDSRELSELFAPIIDLYEIDETGQSTSLVDTIQNEWNIFNLEKDKIVGLLENMFQDTSYIKSNIFRSTVKNKFAAQEDSSFPINQWQAFKDEIKTKNRFFIQNLVELDLLNELIKDQIHTYKAGKYFYRSRISKETGVPKDKIGKPPTEITSPGRANPKGIPYLYVACDEKTSIYEVRATYLDYVTIGVFKLRENIRIIRLREVTNKSPFSIQNLEKYVYYKKFLLELEKELSKPLRRYDSELDYLPSQYLCEFIKSNGYDGVEYASSLNKDGINLAIFNDEKLECIDTKIIEIKNIEIEF